MKIDEPKITRVSTTGKVLHQGDGNSGVVIVDAWSDQEIMHIDDMSDDYVIDLIVRLKGKTHIAESSIEHAYEVHSERTRPVTSIAVFGGGFQRAFRDFQKRTDL